MQIRAETTKAVPKGRTDYERLRKMTDAEIEKAVATDPDAAPILSDEQMRREYQPRPALIKP